MNPKEKSDLAKQLLQGRQVAYVQVFSDEKNLYAKEVLKDLAKFCRADETTWHPDARVHAALEGRREVWLRISQHLKLSLEELQKIYS